MAREQISLPLKAAMLIMLGLMLLTFPSCGEYRTFTLRPYFSFEYPVSYEGPYRADSDTISVSFYHLTEFAKGKYASDIELTVFGISPSGSSPDTESLLKSRLHDAEAGVDIYCFKLMERTSINISSVQAEQFIYTYIGYDNEIVAATKLVRDVIFVHKGVVWTLRMDSDVSTAETANADFEHILQTFKVLD